MGGGDKLSLRIGGGIYPCDGGGGFIPVMGGECKLSLRIMGGGGELSLWWGGCGGDHGDRIVPGDRRVEVNCPLLLKAGNQIVLRAGGSGVKLSLGIISGGPDSPGIKGGDQIFPQDQEKGPNCPRGREGVK